MVAWYTNHNFSVELADKNAMYWAIGTVLVFLAIGLIFLLRVKKVTHKEPLSFTD
jgi:Mg2+ and Co2+ transporter CorA